MDFNRYLRFFDEDEDRLAYGESWGVYQFPDGQNQIWFGEIPASERVCINHPAILDLVRQTLDSVGPLNIFVTYLYGARSDKPLSGTRRVPNIAESSRELVSLASLGKELEILVPHDSQQEAAPYRFSGEISNYDGIIFPDASAKERQPWLCDHNLSEVVFEKIRDQVTGDIIGHTPSQVVSTGRYLVADDICDGGATFVKVAEMLPGCQLDLSVTHGVFSGSALDRLAFAGFGRIFTTNSFVQHDAAKEAEILLRCEVEDIWR